jgi:hypothetical protein
LGLSILFLRHWVPESPRWLVTHGKEDEAKQTMDSIEQRVSQSGGGALPQAKGSLTVHPRKTFGFGLVFGAMLGKHRARSALALVLMVAQAFLFNSVFFTYGLVLQHYEGVADARIGLYILPLCLGNLVGPFALGHLFDTIGRKTMIAGTYAISGVLLMAVAALFGMGLLTATTQTLCWVGVFFFASAAASSAYLTASEIFPLETRALAIAVFYALGTLIGGAAAPWLFGHLIAAGSAWALSGGYCVAGLLMLAGAGMELKFGIDAEGKSLEDIAEPLSTSLSRFSSAPFPAPTPCCCGGSGRCWSMADLGRTCRLCWTGCTRRKFRLSDCRSWSIPTSIATTPAPITRWPSNTVCRSPPIGSKPRW